MYQSSLQPPDPVAYVGEGLRKLHKALSESNLFDLDIEGSVNQALCESGDCAELRDAISEFIWLADILKKMSKPLSAAYEVIDNFVAQEEKHGDQ